MSSICSVHHLSHAHARVKTIALPVVEGVELKGTHRTVYGAGAGVGGAGVPDSPKG